MAKPGSITPHTKFKAEVYILTKEEGGRHTPFFNGYRPQFYFRTTDVTGVVTLPEGVEMVMPGDNVRDGRGVDHADRDGEGVAVCDPGRRPDRGRRRHQRSHRVRQDIIVELTRNFVTGQGKTLGCYAEHHHACLHGMQAAELYDDEEQEERPRINWSLRNTAGSADAHTLHKETK